jgi:hypothetical protein
MDERNFETNLYQEKQRKQSFLESRCTKKAFKVDEKLLFTTPRETSFGKVWPPAYYEDRTDGNGQISLFENAGRQGLLLQQIPQNKRWVFVPRFQDSFKEVDSGMRWGIFSSGYKQRKEKRQEIGGSRLQSFTFERERDKQWRICTQTVKSVTDGENTVDTYDLTVPLLENYVLADGFIVHNSGKSYTSLRLAEILDPPNPETGYEGFNIKRVAFDTEEFLKILKDGLDKKTLHKGSVIVYDEVGVGHSNRNFQDSLNKALNFVFQGFRRENLIVFLTVPKLKFVDLQLRELMHYIVVPKRIDYKKSLVWSKCYVIKQNPMATNDIPFYIHKPKVSGAHFDGVRDLEYFGLSLPSNDLIRDYEEKKKSFMFELYDQAKALAGAVKREKVSSLRKQVETESGGVVGDSLP